MRERRTTFNVVQDEPGYIAIITNVEPYRVRMHWEDAVYAALRMWRKSRSAKATGLPTSLDVAGFPLEYASGEEAERLAGQLDEEGRRARERVVVDRAGEQAVASECERN